MQHQKSAARACVPTRLAPLVLAALLILATTAAEPLSPGNKPGLPTLAVTNEAGDEVQLFSREAFRAEFSYLRRECHQFDLKGQPIPTDGWTDNIPDVEWPFMQFAYFGFACVNLAKLDGGGRAETLAEIRWLMEAMQTPRLSGFMTPNFGEPFGKDEIHPSCFVHGLFLTLALRYREVSGDRQYDEIIHKVAAALSSAYSRTDQAILGSYKTMWWLTDNFPALAGLTHYDRVFQRELAKSKEVFLKSVEAFYLDRKSGMICTFIDPAKHRPLWGPRGVSLMYGLHFLKDFAPGLATNQYRLAKASLFRPFLGYLTVRETPEGQPEIDDVASGPIVFGVGPAASGFAIAAAALNGDQASGWQLAKAACVVGSPILRNGELRYAMMPPVGQAVILYGKTELLRSSGSNPWDNR